MEARRTAIGAPEFHYLFPTNGGLNAADAARAMALGLPIANIGPDLHVGAGGAIEAAMALFANPVVNGFTQGAVNQETNAATQDHARGLAEAADLIDWMTADPAVAGRMFGRAASFCSGASAQFDSWPQGITTFLPNMTWFQSPGYVHVMITNTWAETTLAANQTAGAALPFAAQRKADGSALVFRVVTSGSEQPLTIQFAGSPAAGPSYTQWTLAGTPSSVNTPAQPELVAPVSATVPLSKGSTLITTTLPANAFVVIVVPI